jgi:hypothetical protein
VARRLGLSFIYVKPTVVAMLQRFMSGTAESATPDREHWPSTGDDWDL